MPRPSARAIAALVVILAVVAAFAGGLAMLLDTPKPPPGASRPQQLYYVLCAECHGTDGRGAWRAALFLIRPGDLSDPVRLGQRSDDYLFNLVKQGGAPVGRPGMPAFGYHLSDNDIASLVRYLRELSKTRATASPLQ